MALKSSKKRPRKRKEVKPKTNKRNFKIDKEIFKDVIIPLVVGISSIIVAVNANRIYELQTLIAKNAEAPTMHVQVCNYESMNEIEIYFLDGKYENPQVEFVSFFTCEIHHSIGERWMDFYELEFPMYYYNSYGIGEPDDKYGLVAVISNQRDSTFWNDFMKEIEEYYNEREEPHVLASNIRTYLKISYQNLLGEQEEVYYMVNLGYGLSTKRIDNDLGEKEFIKFQETLKLCGPIIHSGIEKYCINAEDLYQRIMEWDY